MPCTCRQSDPSIPPTDRKAWRTLRHALGRDLRACRDASGLTLAQLSRKTGIPPHVLDHYEMGKGEPRLFDLIRLCRALGVRVKIGLAD